MRRWMAIGGLVLAQGCVQLVAFEQPIVGQPDVIESPDRGDLLCDDGVRLGERAGCDVSCTIEAADRTHSCGERLTLGEEGMTLDVDGIFEVEVTLTACEAVQGFGIRSASGAGVVVAERAARLVNAEGDTAAEQERFLPDEDCADRTLLFQDGRLELVDPGRRWCADALPRFSDGPWRIDRPGRGVDAVEVCLRQPDD